MRKEIHGRYETNNPTEQQTRTYGRIDQNGLKTINICMLMKES